MQHDSPYLRNKSIHVWLRIEMLGTAIKNALQFVGITPSLVETVTKRPCKCRQREIYLNKVSQQACFSAESCIAKAKAKATAIMSTIRLLAKHLPSFMYLKLVSAVAPRRKQDGCKHCSNRKEARSAENTT